MRVIPDSFQKQFVTQQLSCGSMANTDIHWHADTRTPLGLLRLVATERGLRAVLWQDKANPVKLPPDMVANRHHSVLQRATRQIAEYFAGERTAFSLPLDLRGTAFQIAAWRALSDIPPGSTISYNQQSVRIGRPKAARATGQANGLNPVPIVLPCHRVIRAGGSLGGFSGGLAIKAYLLRHEGALDWTL